MSYIAVELDALNQFPAIARAARVSEDAVGAGLVRLWAYCFRKSQDVVTPMEVAGAFAVEVDLVPTLVAFGFLDPASGGRWRVKGASRYLRIAEGRKRGGRVAAAAGNLKRGPTKPENLAQLPASAPQLVPSSLPALAPAQPQLDASLSPTTDDRRPNTIEAPAPKTRRVKKEADARHSDARHRPLLLALEAASPGYVVQARDAKAVKALLALGEPEEVLARWRRALAAEGYPRVRATWELATHWHHFGPEEATRRGPVPAESVDWSGQTETRVLEFGGGQ